MALFAKIAAALDPARTVYVEDERYLGDNVESHRAAAVLIPITRRVEPGVILTQRPEWLSSHPGQVAFPGGKIDAHDENAVAAALREAEEELALPASEVTIIGTADIYYSGSGYRITPVIGSIAADLPLRANPDEVTDWFEVPLAFLLDPANLTQRSAIWNGRERLYYDMQWKNRRIWGVTAGIIANLARRLA